MSQLMHMRQRIKAVQTIKKITHAMRLISMSTHSRMKHQEEPLKLYQQTINHLFMQARQEDPHYHNPILNPEQAVHIHPLVILIGSQKGLCGSFNSALFQLFNTQMLNTSDYDIITVGKRATNYIQKTPNRLVASYNTFGMHNLLTIAENLLEKIEQAQPTYSSVILYSNSAPSFFLQKPIVQQIIPAEIKSEKTVYEHDYYWAQSPQEILAYLAKQYILSQIQHALFQSLLAEHAARFVSMDSSTRNAETLLEQMQRDYNKLRQTKITRELTELSSFFLS
jgi:F-type H+-transporting ATPase subunit gamma